jgi:hypothetical protein
MYTLTPEKLQKRVSITENSASESTPLATYQDQVSSLEDDKEADYVDDYGGEVFFSTLKRDSVRRESMAADRLSMRLLAIADDDSAAEDEILKETLNLGDSGSGSGEDFGDRSSRSQPSTRPPSKQKAFQRLFGMVGISFLGFVCLGAAFFVGVQFIGPPNQPVGPYQLIERQVRNRKKDGGKDVRIPKLTSTLSLEILGRRRFLSILHLL